MKIIVFAIAACLQLAAADRPAQKAPAKRAQAPAQPVEIPAGAVETAAGTYTYTDAQGKKWVYRKTPFGVARMEDKGAGQAATPAPVAPKSARVKATEDGDTVHFERPGPFGVYKWDRKKAELSDAEREWLEQSRQPDSSSRNSRQE